MSMFRKATRKGSRSRTVFSGPSGSGKTMWALVAATILAAAPSPTTAPSTAPSAPTAASPSSTPKRGPRRCTPTSSTSTSSRSAPPYNPERLREIFP